MPFLDEIVKGLNDNWKLKLPASLNMRFCGIAETVIEITDQEKTKRYPAVLNIDGDAIVDTNKYSMIDVDDDFDISIYHRLENIANSVAKRGYGDDPGNMIEFANMAIIVIAFRKAGIVAHKLEAFLKDTMPTSSKLGPANNVIQRSVFKVGNSNFDKLQLLNREYSEVELSYPDVIVFEMKYNVTNIFKKGCYAALQDASEGGVTDCVGMENFTDVSFDQTTLTFTGGNLLGETVGNISIINLPFVLQQGITTLGLSNIPAGTYQVTFRKKCGDTYTDEATKEFIKINTGTLEQRLYPINGDFERNVDFPVFVYNDIPQSGGNHLHQNIGRANTAQEYLDIWNADSENSAIGTILSFRQQSFPGLTFWSFTIRFNDNQSGIDFFRCDPIIE